MEDWKKICQVKELLNERLKELGKPELEGEYFAFTPVYLEETSDSWVVSMEKNSPVLGRKTYDYEKVAKICYFGRWD